MLLTFCLLSKKRINAKIECFYNLFEDEAEYAAQVSIKL